MSLTYRAKITMTPMFISINLLKPFTELPDTFYLLTYNFLSEVVTQEHPGGRDAQCRVWGGVWSFLTLSPPLSPNLHVFTHPELSELIPSV